MKESIYYNDYLKDSLKDSNECVEYLVAALKEGNLATFELALKDVMSSFEGNIEDVLEAAKKELN